MVSFPTNATSCWQYKTPKLVKIIPITSIWPHHDFNTIKCRATFAPLFALFHRKAILAASLRHPALWPLVPLSRSTASSTGSRQLLDLFKNEPAFRQNLDFWNLGHWYTGAAWRTEWAACEEQLVVLAKPNKTADSASISFLHFETALPSPSGLKILYSGRLTLVCGAEQSMASFGIIQEIRIYFVVGQLL